MSDIKARCQCGQVEMVAVGAPIVTTICHCSGCQNAAHILEKLPAAAPILDGSDGVPYALFRKDRVKCVKGPDNLREHRLTEASPTRRVVAVCCNTFMFLDFTKGHWITLAQDRIDGSSVLADAPHQKRQGAGFIFRLMAVWVMMGFRTPTIEYVQGALKDV